jgi:hypothetical protein
MLVYLMDLFAGIRFLRDKVPGMALRPGNTGSVPSARTEPARRGSAMSLLNNMDESELYYMDESEL